MSLQKVIEAIGLNPNGSISSGMGATLLANLQTKATTSALATVAVSGSYTDLANKPTIPSAYTLPIATASTLGGVKQGAGITIDANGIITASGAGVSSIAGRTGAVTLTASDINGLSTVASTGNWGDLTNKPTTVLASGIVDIYTKTQVDNLAFSGGSAPRELRGTFPGTLAVLVGTLRWYPSSAVTLNKVYFSVGAIATGPVQIDVKKNGVSIFSGSYPTLNAGDNLSSVVAVAVGLLTSDYLTIDMKQVNGGSDATVVIQYS